MNFLTNSGLASESPSGGQPQCEEKTPSGESSINLLSGVDLSGVDLICVDLSGVRLIDADLSNAILNFADLSNALLAGANLSGASLYAADLSDADLPQADLSDAVLSSYSAVIEARGVSDDMARFNIEGLIHADPKEAADLSNVDLRSANLSSTVVRGANLSGADLESAYVRAKDGSKHLVNVVTLDQEASSLKGATMPNGQKYEE